jgi:uncharacterized membrane-anchored protein
MTTGQARWDGARTPAGYAASKVPLITAYFWIIKLLSTAMGEATSDYMVRIMNPVIAVLLGAAGWAIAMALVFRAKRYNAWIYWLGVVMVAVFGTMCADVLHIKFHVPYAASTTFYAIVLVVIFVLWYRSEGTLSIHSIRTPRRELFYWATVLATFALGTATGDLTAKTLNLGYLASGIWFSLAFAAVAVAHWKFGLNSILAFWVAYVLTRPVGASFADYVAFPRSVGGLDQGHAEVALVLTFFIVCLVGYMAVTRKDVEEDPGAAYSRAAPSRHRRGPEAAGGLPPRSYEPPPEGRRPMEPQQYDPGSYDRQPYDERPYEPSAYEPSAYEPRSYDQQPYDQRPYEPRSHDQRQYEPRSSGQRSYEPRSYDQPQSYEPRPYDQRPQEPRRPDPRPSDPRPYERPSPEPRSQGSRSQGSRPPEPRSGEPRPYEPRPQERQPYDPRSQEPRSYDPRPQDRRSHGPRPAQRRPMEFLRRRDDVDDEDPAEQTREGFFMWDDQ